MRAVTAVTSKRCLKKLISIPMNDLNCWICGQVAQCPSKFSTEIQSLYTSDETQNACVNPTLESLELHKNPSKQD